MTTTQQRSKVEAQTIVRQIGANILAISGGRWTYGTVPAGMDEPEPFHAYAGSTYVEMRAGAGYRVEVVLTPMDMYEVARVFVRGGKRFIKGVEAAWAGNIGEVAYRASCFRDDDNFGS